MTKEIKVAILAITAALILYFGFFFLKGRNVFSTEQFFTSVFEDVNLLVAGNQVILNGLQVGQVYTTILDPETGLVTVEFTVSEDIKVPKGSIVQIYNADLLGNIAMKIIWPKNGQITGFYEDGAIIPGEIDKGMMAMVEAELLPMKDQLSTMLVSVDTILNGVNRILATKKLDSTLNSVNILTKNLANATNGMDKTVRNMTSQLQGIMNDFESLTEVMVSNQGNINKIIGNATTLTEDFTKVSGKLSELEVDKTLQSFEATLENANNAVAEATQMLENLNAGNGTAGAILKDRQIYDNLDKVTADLDSVLVDFKANPKRYVHFTLIDRTAKIEAKEKRRAERKARKGK